jgi:flavodoxin
MKTLIIYESYHHGNTEKVAEIMGIALDAKLARPRNVDENMLNDYDLIGFGSGIYKGRLHTNVLELIDRLPHMDKKAFIFYTCGMDRGEPYTREVSEKLSRKGFTVVGKFSCPGWDTIPALAWFGGIKKGHPDQADLEKAKAFANGLKR